MTTSSEDVLSLVNHVKHKKSDGVLYIMAERLAWIMNGRDTFTISHKYSDIKLQKISPDGKSKIQLQVVLHDGGASTFHFTNPEGQDAQIQDRNSVKEYLLQLLPRFKRKVNKELEEKNALLANDPELFQLYRDLVTSQVLSAEEFWATYLPERTQTAQVTTNQCTGVSGAFLADVKPQTDGVNGWKYNLTADVIESIFKTYPAVKKKHMENVPDKLSESEFWTRFFQSHYVHRDRLNSAKDLFGDCMKSDELDFKNEIQRITSNPLVNLPAFKDNSTIEDFGDEQDTSQSNLSQSAAINKNLIRRFNHESMMVLKTCDPETKTETTSNVAKDNGKAKEKNSKGKETHSINGVTKHSLPIDEVDSTLSPLEKKAKIQSKIVYEDLECDNTSNISNLNLSRADRYLHGPTPVTSIDYATNEELMQSVEIIHREISTWEPQFSEILPNTSALTVLGELSPGGALMTRTHMFNLQQTVPQHVQEELKNLYAAVCELLRHFWSCFPVNSEFLEEKVVRMKANLERFQYAKLMPFQDTLLRDHLNTNLADHLNELIEAAFMKFNNWQMRRQTTRKLMQ